MAQEDSKIDLRGEFNDLLKRYFQQNGFVQTCDSFIEECAKLGKPIAARLDSADVVDDKIKTFKEELLHLFDDGDAEFFQRFEEIIPTIRNESSPEFLKLEFSLQLHFTIFMMRRGLNPTQVQLEHNTQRFKSYLDNRGSALSQEPDYLPYFALPYIQNPSQHSSFVELFKDSWVDNVRQQLEAFLNSKLRMVVKSHQDESLSIMEIYELYHTHVSNMNSQQVDDIKHELQMERLKLLKVQENYQKLMHITTELLSALETSVKGEEVNLSDVMDTCLRAFPELFQGVVVVNGNSNGLADDSVIQKEERHSTPLIRSKTHELLLISLDYKQLKKDLVNGAPRLKLFVLQALRWRLTMSRPGDQRRSVLSAYISNDLLGVRGADYGDAILSLIMTPTVELRQSMARLLNALASLTSGRSYLSHGPHILVAIMDNVRLNKLDTASLDMSLATLQKLSLRRQLQTAMIENFIIEWLLSLLEDDSLSDYALEYAVALLMNLCLRTAGKQRCVRNPHTALKVLTNLLGHQNQEIVPYVNGTLYSLLSVPSIKKEAQNMGLEAMLNFIMKESSSEMKRQLEFILRQLLAEDPIEEVLSDYEDEDDDDEEQDVLEEELDKEDLVVVVPGELQGEQLLAARYSVHANVSKPRTAPEEFLVRPTTPRSQGLMLRRRSSSQMWSQQTAQFSTDSVDGLSSHTFIIGQSPSSPNPNKNRDPNSPTLNVDHYASHVLNEVVGIDKPVAEAVSFPPILPKEPQKFGSSSSVNEFVVAFSSRPKILRTPEHSARRSSLSPRSDYESHSTMPSRDG